MVKNPLPQYSGSIFRYYNKFLMICKDYLTDFFILFLRITLQKKQTRGANAAIRRLKRIAAPVPSEFVRDPTRFAIGVFAQ